MKEWRLQEDFLRFKGIFEMEKLYRTLHGWFSKRGYRFIEELYKDKPPETEIIWTGTRKITDYYLYKVRLRFHIWDMEDVEVVKNDEKKVMQKGRMKITFTGSVITDYSKRWEESAFMKWLETVYTDYIFQREIELKHVEYLYYVIYQLHELAKKTLEMEASDGAY